MWMTTSPSHGLFNKRIKSVGGMLRGIPIGLTRTMIDTQLQIQGAGAVRGASGAAKGYSRDRHRRGRQSLSGFPDGPAGEEQAQNGVEQLREGEVAWEACRA